MGNSEFLMTYNARFIIFVHMYFSVYVGHELLMPFNCNFEDFSFKNFALRQTVFADGSPVGLEPAGEFSISRAQGFTLTQFQSFTGLQEPNQFNIIEHLIHNRLNQQCYSNIDNQFSREF